MDYLIAIVFFAISSSVTPGPNNIMVMTSGVNFGVRKSLPLLSGICVGFTVMLLLVGLGFGQIFELFPQLYLVIKFAGISYLLYLAWLIAKSDDVSSEGEQSRPLTFVNGALFQWVNAKAWIVATGAIAAFTTVGADFYSQNYTLAATFLLVSFPCVGLWLFFGSMLKNALKKPTYRKAFNYLMAALLALSVVPVAMDLVSELT